MLDVACTRFEQDSVELFPYEKLCLELIAAANTFTFNVEGVDELFR